MRKKSVAIIAIICLLIFVNVGNVSAAGTYEIRVSADKANVERGDTVEVTFSLANISVQPGIGAMTAKLEYDKTVFEKVTSEDIHSEDGWDDMMYNDVNESEGFFIIDRKSADTINVDNDVFGVAFKVLSTAKLGETQIKLTNISSSNGKEEIEITDVIGKLTVIETPEEPTDDPTEKPSDDPTEKPSDDPAEEPTDDPTEKPSDDPTEKPSDDPAEKPTDDPTEKPSDDPTEKPSDDPTEKPSDDPTEKPSDDPTEKPSDDPTEKPSDDPTEKPSDDPTEKPSDDPTEKPSDDPTEKPTTQNKPANNTNTSDKDIPYAGNNDYMILVMFVVMVIGVFGYIQYRKMKNI